MRKNSKNEKVIRAMAIGISAMLMASSPLTALAAEGEGNSSEGNEDKNITVTPEAGVCDQAEAVAKDADKAVEGAEKSAADVKAEVVDKVAAGDVKDAEGKDLSQDILDANAKVEDKTVKDGSSLKDAESAVENADTTLGVAEANDKLSDAELNKAADAAANAGQTAAEAKDAMQASQDKVNGQIENIKDAASITDANAAYEEVKTTVDQAQTDFDAKLGEYNTAKAAYEEAEHAAKFAEMLGEDLEPNMKATTKDNLKWRVDCEFGATAGKVDLAKCAKKNNLDAIHDTVHEMARDEARHGKALKGLLDRYFG